MEATKCPLRDEWISKMWHGHIMEYYSAFKRKKILIHTTTWVKLEDIMLSEINQSQKRQIPYDSTYMRYLPVVIFIETESRILVARG